MHLRQEGLIGRGGVFVVPQDEFELYWDLFKMQMQEAKREEGGGGKGLRFAHNRNVKDESLVHPKMYLVQEGLDARYPQRLTSRMSVLVTSGIYLFWERVHSTLTLDEVRRERNIMVINENIPLFEPLSFHSSNVHLNFDVALLCWLLCLVVFVMEWLWPFHFVIGLAIWGWQLLVTLVLFTEGRTDWFNSVFINV